MPIPPRLYKYRPISEFTEDIIVNSRVFFAAPTSFNDPFDCTLPLDFRVSPTELVKHVTRIAPHVPLPRDSARAVKALKPTFDKWKATILRELSAESSVFCGSECSDDVLMFSHYPYSHRGCCLEFDFTSDPVMKNAESVRYTSVFPELNYFKLHGPHGSLTRSLILTKAQQWAYEREWRAFRHRQPPGLHQFDPKCLTGVILGAGLSPNDETEVRKWVSRSPSKVQLFRASVSRTHYKLDIRPIK